MSRDAADILLVEDDPNDVTIALRAFRRHGLEDRVAVASDGEAALAYVRGRNGHAVLPRVVFLDVKMPRMDGWEVLRELRADERTEHLPVVMVSSSSRSGDVRESYRLGANSFLVKRFRSERPGEYLVEAARYWLDLNEGCE